MKGFIDIHTHNANANNAVLNFYDRFESSKDVKYCSLGLHPWFLDKFEEQFDSLSHFSSNKNVIAIGECGLDKISTTNWQTQIKVFTSQINLAEKLNKPLIIHCVKAYQECVTLLNKIPVPVIFHGFNRNSNIANLLLENGFYLSIGASIFSESMVSTIKQIPLDKLFFETDNREDVTIDSIYKRAAETKKISLEALILQIEQNFQKVFLNER